MRLFFIFFLCCSFLLPIYSGYAQENNREKPPTLKELQNIPKLNLTGLSIDNNDIVDEETGQPFDIRRDAQREAALSYGARGGLAWGTYHIRQELEERSTYMDKVFDFRQLLVPAQSGLLIEPPVISEEIDTLIINADGLEAAVSDRIYNIGRNARIVSAPRTWRLYLEREWGTVSPPPDILRPDNSEERDRWRLWVSEGWEQGLEQADEVFQFDLNRLTADYQGMVRYRMLLAQGMVSPPLAMQVDRGITGGGDQMRVGDRAVTIQNLPALRPGYQSWQPANR